MKKIFIALLTVLTLFNITGCSSKRVKLAPGETLSTDIIDLTLEYVDLGYYGNPVIGITNSDDMYVASAGHVLVAMTFTVNNKDRASLNIGNFGTDWSPNWSIKYNGKEYPIRGYESNNKDGSSYLRMDRGCLVSSGMKSIDTINFIQESGTTVTYMVIGIAGFDPKSLDDSFELIASAPDSTGKLQTATYSFN